MLELLLLEIHYAVITITYRAFVCDRQMAETARNMADAAKVKFSIRLITCTDC